MEKIKEISYMDKKSDVKDLSNDIKISSNLREESAMAYASKIFDEMKNFDLDKKMFNYDVTDFDLKFDFTDDVIEKINDFSKDKWDTYSMDQKKEVIEYMAGILNEHLGVKDKISIEYFKDEPNICGVFNERYRSVEINENIFDNSREVLDTLVHEIKHAYQRYRADIRETETDKLYDYNFKNYVSPYNDENGNYVNFDNYQNQFIEAEARVFAKLFTERLF